jgi:hypothetical protein
VRISRRRIPQTTRITPPLHTRIRTQAKRRLVMDIDALWHVRQGDDIHIVGGVVAGGRHGRGLDEAREALSVAIGVLIRPVADGDGGPGVGIGLVDVGLGAGVDGGKEEGAEGEGGGGGFHD